MQSLTDYINSLRSEFELFELFERKVQELIISDVYNEQNARKRVRSTRITFREGNKEEVSLSLREHFRITVFLQIIDSILAAMQRRVIAYSGVRDKFSFLHNIVDLPDSCLREACKLVRAYSTDLEPSLIEEMIQFKYFLNSSTQDGTFPNVKKKGTNYCTEVKYYSAASSQCCIPGIPDSKGCRLLRSAIILGTWTSEKRDPHNNE